MENELVNKAQITIKGLYALCLVHNVSITYVSGNSYYTIGDRTNASSTANASSTIVDTANASSTANASEHKCGIIVKNEKKEDSLRVASDNAEYLKKVQEEYWYIENIQKPLKSPASYTLKELQDICTRLNIDLTTTSPENEKIKSKTKKVLYEDVLQYI